MGTGVLDVDDNNFESEILKAEKPALVDFWAPLVRPLQGYRTCYPGIGREIRRQHNFRQM